MATTRPGLGAVLADFGDVPQLQALTQDLFNHRVSSEVAASLIAIAAKEKKGNEETNDYTDNVSSIIIACATDVPSMHGVLTKLVLELDTLYEHEVRESIFANFWAELSDTLSSVWHGPKETERYINLTSFEAQLWQLSNGRVGEFLYYDAVKNLALGLEKAEDDCLQGLDGEIAAAAMWAIHGELDTLFHSFGLPMTFFGTKAPLCFETSVPKIIQLGANGKERCGMESLDTARRAGHFGREDFERQRRVRLEICKVIHEDLLVMLVLLWSEQRQALLSANNNSCTYTSWGV